MHVKTPNKTTSSLEHFWTSTIKSKTPSPNKQAQQSTNTIFKIVIILNRMHWICLKQWLLRSWTKNDTTRFWLGKKTSRSAKRAVLKANMSLKQKLDNHNKLSQKHQNKKANQQTIENPSNMYKHTTNHQTQNMSKKTKKKHLNKKNKANLDLLRTPQKTYFPKGLLVRPKA